MAATKFFSKRMLILYNVLWHSWHSSIGTMYNSSSIGNTYEVIITINITSVSVLTKEKFAFIHGNSSGSIHSTKKEFHLLNIFCYQIIKQNPLIRDALELPNYKVRPVKPITDLHPLCSKNSLSPLAMVGCPNKYRQMYFPDCDRVFNILRDIFTIGGLFMLLYLLRSRYDWFLDIRNVQMT